MNSVIGIIILLLIIVAIVGYIIRLYNKLILLKFNTEKAFANIDVILKQRAEEIPNLIKTVKEHMGYEKETLQALTELRTRYLNASNTDEKVRLNNDISNAFSKIMVVAEAYPDLKAKSSFVKLQTRVSEVEDNIADRREFFNESINMYNVGINEFPAMILASIMNYKDKALLLISDTEKEYDGVTF